MGLCEPDNDGNWLVSGVTEVRNLLDSADFYFEIYFTYILTSSFIKHKYNIITFHYRQI